MNIALFGYGKMGQEIEKLAKKKGHKVTLIFNCLEDWDENGHQLKNVDMAIDFSSPVSVVENIYHCFEAGVPVVVGTTGWLDDFEKVRSDCKKLDQTLFFAPNFSIGVNLFFQLNRFLAQLMSKWEEYSISIEETHHIHKQDAPSGTAIVLANDIIRFSEKKEKWVREEVENPEEVGIKSYRTDNVPGTHVVRYESDDDSIEIIHTAKNRRGFALGAVMAAEFLLCKKGYFEMKNLLGPQILLNT